LRKAADAAGGHAGLVFFYLPTPLRLIAAKDLRTFLRDPLQWSQLAILFGLLVLYLTNIPALQLELTGSVWALIAPFLNLCAISLILATFTCRFVFPLVSLEGQKLWLVGLLPMPRRHLLLAKLAFAMTVTLLGAVGAMGLATVMLDLNPTWAVIHLGITVAVCFGLCGFSVGIGARLPMFDQPNVARIANGLGGTTNLLASLALITAVLACVAVATWRSRYLPAGSSPDAVAIAYCIGGALVGVVAGVAALVLGARHFDRIDV
jgi:ABC-2 type transport system permease protein